MNSRRTNAFPAAMAVTALITGTLMGAPAMAAELTAAAPGGRLEILSSILSFHRADYSESGPDIKIFGAGGGDPAMNGSFVFICINHESKSLVWETGLNVREITRIVCLPGDTVRVQVTEDVMNKNGSISNRKATYQFRFRIEGGELQKKLGLDKL